MLRTLSLLLSLVTPPPAEGRVAPDTSLEPTPTNMVLTTPFPSPSTQPMSLAQMRTVLASKCTAKYSLSCLKLDLVRLIGVLSSAPPFTLMPGVVVTPNSFGRSGQPSPLSLDVLVGLTSSPENSTLLDIALHNALDSLLRGLTINVRLYNDEALDFITSHNAIIEEGRGKKHKFLSIYTVFAIAFALLSALVGKAMTLSIVSLVIAMVARNVGNNNSPNSPVYDIVRRPQIQYTNTHSQEDVYEAAHSGYPVSYAAYPRGGKARAVPPYLLFQQQQLPSASHQQLHHAPDSYIMQMALDGQLNQLGGQIPPQEDPAPYNPTPIHHHQRSKSLKSKTS